MHRRLTEDQHELSLLQQRVIRQSPDKTIRLNQERIHYMGTQLATRINARLDRLRYRLASSTHTLNAVSPIATLSRGYSITFHETTNRPVREAGEVKVGESIQTRLASGKLKSRIESIDE